MESIIEYQKSRIVPSREDIDTTELTTIINSILCELEKLNYINRTTYSYDTKIDKKYIPFIIVTLHERYGKFLDVGEYISLKPNQSLVSSLVVNGMIDCKNPLLACILDNTLNEISKIYKPKFTEIVNKIEDHLRSDKWYSILIINVHVIHRKDIIDQFIEANVNKYFEGYVSAKLQFQSGFTFCSGEPSDSYYNFIVNVTDKFKDRLV